MYYRGFKLLRDPSQRVGIERLKRLREGQTLEQIAATDGIVVANVATTIREAVELERAEIRERTLDAKIRAELKNEKIRALIRNQLGQKYITALELLLDGQKSVVIKNEAGFEEVVTITDLEAVANGLKHFRESISLQERPAAPQTNIVVDNRQQTANLRITDREQMIDRIRSQQALGHERLGLISRPVQIEVTAEEQSVETLVEEIENEAAAKENPEEAWQF